MYYIMHLDMDDGGKFSVDPDITRSFESETDCVTTVAHRYDGAAGLVRYENETPVGVILNPACEFGQCPNHAVGFVVAVEVEADGEEPNIWRLCDNHHQEVVAPQLENWTYEFLTLEKVLTRLGLPGSWGDVDLARRARSAVTAREAEWAATRELFADKTEHVLATPDLRNRLHNDPFALTGFLTGLGRKSDADWVLLGPDLVALWNEGKNRNDGSEISRFLELLAELNDNDETPARRWINLVRS